MASSASSPSAVDDVQIVEAFDYDGVNDTVEMKLDLEATSFSEQNAFFLANMSALAYDARDEVQKLLQKQGFWGEGEPAQFEWFEADDEVASRSTFDAIHDTEAYVAANESVVIAVFRGSKGRTDWLTNLSILPRDVPTDWKLPTTDGDLHRGFDDGVNTVWTAGHAHPEGMVDVIKRYLGEEGKSRKLYLTGHSLGGGLATIAAARLAFVHPDIDIAGVFTYGAPRVFDAEVAAIFDATVNFGTAMKDKFFRARNNNDIVPRVPPYPYEHVGKEVYFDRYGNISTTNIVDRILGRLSAMLRLKPLDGINDHSRFEYKRLFAQAVINKRVSVIAKTKSVVVDAVQKVIPVNKEEAEEQQQEIDAAMEAALEASTSGEEFVPESIPEHLVEPDQA